ncbi:MAG: WD40/YVTN/BNR-like repeat-containing protein [Pyrinomonadaceae bacterium]
MMEKTRRQIGMKLNVLVAIAILLVSNVGLLLAAVDSNNEPVKFNDWQIVGPSGGDVRVVAIDPRDKDKLYISTLDGQIHTSADGGKKWRLLVNFNRPQLILDQLFVDSRDSNIIYASGHRHKEPGGFFKTSDGGATWKESKDLRKESIHSMVQSKIDPDVIMVGTINGVWVSKDSGNDWKKISSDTMPINVDSLAIDPRSSDTIFAGTWWRAYKSTDSGKSWRLIKNGMIDDSDVFAITIDSKNPDHIIASACSGIYESLNNGEKWTKVQGIPSQSRRTRDIVQNPAIPGTIYAATTEGFWMTTNGGKNWAMTSRRDLEINSIAVHPDAPDRVFIGTNNYGVMVSNDGGKNFAPTNDNFTSRFTYSITPDIEISNRFYATTQNTTTGGGFFFISNDGGKNWQQAKSLDISRISPFAVIQDRTDSNLLYLATNVGMFKSLDRGSSWTQIVTPKPPPAKKTTARKSSRRSSAKSKTTAATKQKTIAPVAKVETVPVEPTIPGLIPVFEERVKVLSYTEDGQNGVLAGTDNGLYRSYDISKGWEKISLGEGIDTNIFVIYTTPQQPDTIWVGTAVSGVIVSRDNGKTWQKVGGAPDGVPVSSITIDPKRPNYIYLGTSQTFYLSRDGGKTWSRRGGNLPLGNYTSILVNPRNTDEIYTSSALESDGGIFYSDNAGLNWKRIDSKDLKLPSHRVWAMVFDPNDSNRIFAGTHSSGVYRIERTGRPNLAEKITPTDNLSRPRVVGN